MSENLIHSRLKALGMTQAELARKAKLSPGYVNDLINGRRGQRMGAEAAQRLSKALKVKPLFLLQSLANAKKFSDDIRNSERP